MPTAASTLIEQMQSIDVLPNSLALWGLGQMGVAIKGPDATLYIDPALSDVLREQMGDWWTRAYDPPMPPDAITNANFYLISHEHLDHLDPATVRAAAQTSRQATFVAPGWCVELLADLDIARERILVPPALEPITLPGTSVRVTAVPAAHYEKEYDEARGFRWIGFLIQWNGVTFYHAGDTIIYPGYLDTLQQLPRPDVALLPVNGRDSYRETEHDIVGNLLPDEAARLVRDLGVDVFIPGHNDLIANNAIPNGHIVDALDKIAPLQKFKFLRPGELYLYVKA